MINSIENSFLFSREFVVQNKILILDNNGSIDIIHHCDDNYLLVTVKNLLLIKYNINPALKHIDKKDFVHMVRQKHSDLAIEFSDDNNDIQDKTIDVIRDDAPIVNLLNEIISSAVERDATDIHIESLGDHIDVRFRVGLFLTSYTKIEKSLFEQLAIRIKFLAKLNIHEKRLPQDGKTTLHFNNQNIELRVSIIPTKTGESIVLRILKIENENVTLDDLGFSSLSVDRIKDIAQKKSGMILSTGPTGSGKTTTLHSLLRFLNDGEKKIITIEDPVEYVIEGINQIQVNEEIGLSFSTLLRKILRHDPDIIMVGEIRDKDTAKLAFSASLTGHMVFSTLHTNDAVTTFKRLRDLEIDPYLIESSLKLIISQRLVRKLCPHCKKEIELPKEFINRYNLDFTKAYASSGCDLCKTTGYAGLTIIYELLETDDILKNLIIASAGEEQFVKHLTSIQFKTIVSNGIDKIASGDISYKDFSKVIE